MVAFNENVDHSIDSPLAGLGYGLPISRSYARYFGGDLSIMVRLSVIDYVWLSCALL